MDDLKVAMRAGDAVTRDTIRFLQSEIKNFEIDNGEQNDTGVQKIIASQVKKMNEAIEEFAKASRSDLVTEEKAKVEVLSKYLPKQLGDEELTVLVQKTISEMSDTSNRGQVIGAVMKVVAGQADGGRVSAKVNEILKV